MGAGQPAIESSAESFCHRSSVDRNKTHLLRPRARCRRAYLRIRKSPRNARKTLKPYLHTRGASERVPALLRAWLDNKSPSSGPVCLLQISTGRKRFGTVENADIIQPEK